MSYIDELASGNDFVTVETAGKSVEGRDIKLVTLSTGGGGTKPAIYIDAGN